MAQILAEQYTVTVTVTVTETVTVTRDRDRDPTCATPGQPDLT
jgi:hypothetical protein